MTTYQCDNCEWTGDESALLECYDIWSRLEPGDTVQSGDCPLCGASCFPVETHRDRLDALARAFMDMRPELARRSLDEWLTEHRAALSPHESMFGTYILNQYPEYGGEDKDQPRN
jgi:predicted RNA-binding Zn-ribbon protein involved in translation (DUF1610 family)